MLKTHLPKFRPDLSVRLKEIAEKQVLGRLKPIVTVNRIPRTRPL